MIEQIIKVTGYANPIRLDRFLREKFKGSTQGLIEKSLRKSKITVNGARVTGNFRISNGDEIKLDKFEFESTYKVKKTVIGAEDLATRILNEYKIFENQNFLIINKPANLAVQGGTKIKLSVDDALQYLNKHHLDEYDEYYKITHRLDKDTSGLLLIAKGKDAAYQIGKGFKERTIKKKYLAMVNGLPKEPSGTIESNIGKVDSKSYQKVEEDNVGGKNAVTDYQVIKTGENQTLVEFIPHTGRMHQIRFHARSIGCPIIGDQKYGEQECKVTEYEEHLYLHASELHLPETIFGESFSFKAPLPKYWMKYNITDIEKD